MRTCLTASPPHLRPTPHPQLDDLLEKIWQYAGMVRVYTKPKGQITDFNEPVVLRRNLAAAEAAAAAAAAGVEVAKRGSGSRGSYPEDSVAAFCDHIHKSILGKLKYAWVWGSSVRYQPQRVGKDHILADEDVVQIVAKIL